jgi:hypothetical protein
VGAALALGGAFTAHADSAAEDAPADAQKARAASPVASTSTGKHAKPYVPGSETDVPGDAKPAKPYVPGSETDVPRDAKPAKPVRPATPAE